MKKRLEQERQELSLIGELMVALVMKGITAADVASILYEEFVNRLETRMQRNSPKVNYMESSTAYLSLTESLPGRSEAYGNNNEHT